MALTLSSTGQGGVFTLRGGSFGGRFTTSVTPPPSATLLLDTYSGAAAAYSLRKLRTAYSGAAIRVRRSSDNTETDIGFNGTGGLDTTALSTFVGANDGFVTTWYDQSGNSNNLTQTTTARQPRVMLSGVLEQQLNKPTIKITNNFQVGLLSSYNLTNPFSIITLIQQEDGFAASSRIINSNSLNSLITIKRSDSLSIYTGATVVSNFPSQILSTPYLINFYRQGSSNYVYQNNSAVTISSTSSTNWGTVAVGAGDVFGENQNSKISELIIYPTNQLSNNSGISSNINSFYSVYWQGTGTALLDLYPSAATAYSLRNLSSTYTGPLIRVRRSSDNTEQDIYGTFAGVLDTAALTTFCGAGSGFVTRWYDQSGNGRNASQSTTANQPQIVSSGAIISVNGKPALQVDGTDSLTFTSINVALRTTFGVIKRTAINTNFFIYGGGVSHYHFNNMFYFEAVTRVLGSNNVDNTSSQMLLSGYNSSDSLAFQYKNNVLISSTLSSQVFATAINSLFFYGGSLYSQGNAQEIIIYATDNNANISGINSNINSYYSIY